MRPAVGLGARSLDEAAEAFSAGYGDTKTAAKGAEEGTIASFGSPRAATEFGPTRRPGNEELLSPIGAQRSRMKCATGRPAAKGNSRCEGETPLHAGPSTFADCRRKATTLSLA